MNLELCNDPVSNGPIHFYEVRAYWASNFSSFAVTHQSVQFMTSEHAYHSAKFVIGSSAWQCSAFATSAHESMVMSRRNTHMVWPDWEYRKRAVMKEIVAAKLSQHPYIQKKLRETGDRELIEVSPVDSFWGWGPDRNGRNELGKIWMELRAEMPPLIPNSELRCSADRAASK